MGKVNILYVHACFIQAEAAASSGNGTGTGSDGAPKDSASMIEDDGFIVLDDMEVEMAVAVESNSSSSSKISTVAPPSTTKRGIEEVNSEEGCALKKHKVDKEI